MVRWVSLVLVGLAAGALWRLEVELWGWEGLTWLTYPHLAVPVGVLLFVAWTAAAAPLPRRRRLWTAGALLTLIPIGYVATRLGLRLAFASGMTMLSFLLMSVPPLLIQAAVAVLLLVVPVSVVAVASGAGLRLSWARLAAVFAGYFGAWPLAAAFLGQINHPGGGDLIHALKSGAVIPLLVVSLGALFLAPRRSIVHHAGSPNQR